MMFYDIAFLYYYMFVHMYENIYLVEFSNWHLIEISCPILRMYILLMSQNKIYLDFYTVPISLENINTYRRMICPCKYTVNIEKNCYSVIVLMHYYFLIMLNISTLDSQPLPQRTFHFLININRHLMSQSGLRHIFQHKSNWQFRIGRNEAWLASW